MVTLDPAMSPEDVAAALLADDAASAALGMELVSVGRGAATMRMVVRPTMLNGHRTGHGGLIAALADSTFAVACNSRGVETVASGFAIEFLAPVRLGDVLVAEAVEVAVQGRSGVYDVTVRREDGGEVVATFRGRSRSLGVPLGELPG